VEPKDLVTWQYSEEAGPIWQFELQFAALNTNRLGSEGSIE
jgi:hypothetical protein